MHLHKVLALTWAPSHCLCSYQAVVDKLFMGVKRWVLSLLVFLASINNLSQGEQHEGQWRLSCNSGWGHSG